MLNINIPSSILLHYRTDDRKFYGALDILVSNLLAKAGNYHGNRPTDGIILEHKTYDTLAIHVAGIIAMIEGQYVEPIKARFELEDNKIIKSNIYFGQQTPSPIKHGSSEHRKMEQAILAKPDIQYNWKYTFSFDGQHWTMTT